MKKTSIKDERATKKEKKMELERMETEKRFLMEA